MKNKKILGTGSLLGVLLFVLNGCFYDQVIPVEPSIADVGNVTFAADIIPIFNSSCNGSGCHSGSIKPNLLAVNAYAGLLNGGYVDKENPENSVLYKRMKGVGGSPMPPSGSNATHNAKVLKWIELGALNN